MASTHQSCRRRHGRPTARGRARLEFLCPRAAVYQYRHRWQTAMHHCRDPGPTAQIGPTILLPMAHACAAAASEARHCLTMSRTTSPKPDDAATIATTLRLAAAPLRKRPPRLPSRQRHPASLLFRVPDLERRARRRLLRSLANPPQPSVLVPAARACPVPLPAIDPKERLLGLQPCTSQTHAFLLISRSFPRTPSECSKSSGKPRAVSGPCTILNSGCSTPTVCRANEPPRCFPQTTRTHGRTTSGRCPARPSLPRRRSSIRLAANPQHKSSLVTDLPPPFRRTHAPPLRHQFQASRPLLKNMKSFGYPSLRRKSKRRRDIAASSCSFPFCIYPFFAHPHPSRLPKPFIMYTAFTRGFGGNTAFIICYPLTPSILRADSVQRYLVFPFYILGIPHLSVLRSISLLIFFYFTHFQECYVQRASTKARAKQARSVVRRFGRSQEKGRGGNCYTPRGS
jgi:hypothetical protein